MSAVRRRPCSHNRPHHYLAGRSRRDRRGHSRAHVCDACLEQFYDDAVSEALRRLAEEGFPAAKADREISVPVFSLTGRIQSRPALPDDTYVD